MNIPPGTQLLILANVTIFLVGELTGNSLVRAFGLWPIDSQDFGIWQIATYGFLHASWWHLFVNMFAVFMFGGQIEMLFGQRFYLTYFLVCIFSAAIAQLIVAAILNEPPYPTIGASGGVFGLLLAYGMYFPKRTVMLLFPPIPMKAKYMVIVFGALELYFGLSGREPGIANFAHLGGMLFGFILIQRWRSASRR